MLRVVVILAIISVASVSAMYTVLCPVAANNDRKCPLFTVVKKEQHYEERSYSPAVWVESTQKPGESKLDVFTRLFQYVKGANAKGKAVPRRLPVVGHMSLQAGVAQHESMRFFLGQDTPSLNAPRPTNPDVHLHKDPAMNYYVLNFTTSDWRNMELWKSHARRLKTLTGSAHNEFCAASYGPKEGEKYNEIWIHTSADHSDHHYHHHRHNDGHDHHHGDHDHSH